MIAFQPGVTVWIAGGATDMRRGMNTLALQVQEGMGCDPHAGEIFCLRGRKGNLIKRHWPDTRILLREDGHYAWPELMDWCKVASVRRVHAEAAYAARSWKRKRRVIARIKATTLGMDIRAIVTSQTGSTPERLCEIDYCARGQAENLIKRYKTQLKSDRTSCSSAVANQVRLILHTAAYWLLWAVRRAAPDGGALWKAEFAILRLRLVKIGARVIETATRIRIAFTSAYPDRAAFVAALRALRTGNPPKPQAP